MLPYCTYAHVQSHSEIDHSLYPFLEWITWEVNDLVSSESAVPVTAVGG